MQGKDENWISHRGDAELIWYHKYLNGLYFAIITMVTVGYGDISPWTPIEKLYGILMTLLSCGTFAFSLNTIGTIFTNMS